MYLCLTCVSCLVQPSVCVIGYRCFYSQLSRVWYALFMVIDAVSRLGVQTRRGPLGVCRESRRRVLDGIGRSAVRSYFVFFFVAVDSVLAVSGCVF